MGFIPASPLALIDESHNTKVVLDPYGGMRIAQITRLLGSNFDSASINTNFWNVTENNGASVITAGSLARLESGPAADGVARLRSKKTGRLISGSANSFQTGVRVYPIIGNSRRRWGIATVQDGWFFELDGVEISIVSRKANIETRVTAFNGSFNFILDENFHRYEIYYFVGRGMFFQDGNLIHTESGKTETPVNTSNLPIFYENANTGAVSQSTYLEIRGTSINRFGQAIGRPCWKRINGEETVTLKSSAGTLHRLIVGKTGGANAQITLHDGIDAAGGIIARIDTSQALRTIEFDVDFENGLTYEASANPGDLTLFYD